MTGDTVTKNVLIAEDSAVIQDIIKLFLSKNGHKVTIAGDGQETLECLLKEDFDVALIDYHLPKLNGIELVRRFLDAAVGRKVPRLLAMTGDTEGFLAHSKDCELFEMVFPKPIDVAKIVPIIESDESKPIAHKQFTNDPVRRSVPSSKPLDHLELNFVTYPDDFSSGSRPVEMAISLHGSPDGIVLTHAPSFAARSMLASFQSCHASPVIDLSGKLDAQSDICRLDDRLNDVDVQRLAEDFSARRSRIHPDFLTPENPAERLLARMYASGKGLIPQYDPEYRRFVVYSTLEDPAEVETSAKQLEAEGLVAGQFFDRIHACPNCQSARLSPREECTNCSSTNLTEEPYIHHFKCAYQGPASQFRSGDDLICPKCQAELRHFGRDYDKPGIMLTCESCSTAMGDPDVGFLCLDCSTHSTGAQILTRDIFSYRLLSRGMEMVESGRITGSALDRAFQFSDLPISLVVRLNKLARTAGGGQEQDFALLSVTYKALRQVEREEGAGLAERTRTLLFERLSEVLAPDHSSIGSRNTDYMLFATPVVDLEAQLTQALSAIQPEVKLDLKPVSEIYRARDIFGV